MLINDVPLRNWTISGFPLENVNAIEELAIESIANKKSSLGIELNSLIKGPVIFHANFDINASELHDTYVNTEGWGKVYLSHSLQMCSINLLIIFSIYLTGNFIHQWFQSRKILATGRTSNHDVLTQTTITQTQKYINID